MCYEVTTTLTPREALEQALADFGPGGLGLDHVSSQCQPGLPGRWRVYRGDRPARRQDDARVGGPRVGLCRAALHGQGAAAAPLVAALVASQATGHVPTGVIYHPR